MRHLVNSFANEMVSRLSIAGRRRLNGAALLLLIASSLTGCGYNNPYHKPDVAVANQWTVADRHMTPTDEKNTPYLAWWRGFNDPTLNQLIDSGLVSNNSLNMSRGHIEAAEGELKKVHYQWIPDLDAMVGYSRNPATGFPGMVAVLIPTYTMNVFKQIQEQKQAKYKLAQVKAEDDAVKLAVISEISASYFTYQAEVERKRLLQDLANDLTRLAIIGEKGILSISQGKCNNSDLGKAIF